MSSDSLDTLLADAVLAGDETTFEALARAGPSAVEHLRSWLAGERRLQLPSGRDREFVDNTTEVSCRLAGRFPDEFLRTFNSPRWIENSYVLSSLGHTRLPEAKPLLIQALRSTAPGVTRLSAAIALGRLDGPDAVEALINALNDEDYLVKYHAIRSLGVIGDREALDRLLAIAADPPNRGIALVAPDAARSLARRLGLKIEVPSPDMAKWPAVNFRPASDADE